MEVVNILDIDGIQWEVQDVEARNKISASQTEIEKLKTVEKWVYNIPIYGGEIIARKQGNVVSVTGTNIGRVEAITKDIGDINFAVLPKEFRPSTPQFFMVRTSGSYITQLGGVIYPAGNINFYAYEIVDYGYFSISYIID